ncbi:hypothetical protein E5288_WYG007398 [Bos mutus]|uniref:KRAB domain-containing protein n=1 Tax=Bos mutus TaxID=72004 RepID=A0A6B0S579_9CETA|nr:hypothetical protein [Bos mutus]
MSEILHGHFAFLLKFPTLLKFHSFSDLVLMFSNLAIYYSFSGHFRIICIRYFLLIKIKTFEKYSDLIGIPDRLKCIFSKGITTLSGGTLIGVTFIFDDPSSQDTSRTYPNGVLDADAGRASPPSWTVGRMAARGAPCSRCSPASVEGFQGYGVSVSKPDVISLLEQGKEPWMVKEEGPRGACPGWEYTFKNKEFPSKQVIYEESSKVMMMGRSHLSYNLNCSSWRGDCKSKDWFKNQLGTQEVHASQLIVTHREILNEDHSNEYTKSWQTFHQDTIFDIKQKRNKHEPQKRSYQKKPIEMKQKVLVSKL